MELSDILFFPLSTISIEILAALAGIYYLRKSASPSKNSKYFVLFLWFTVSVEVIASYVIVAYYSDYKYFSFVEGTPFRNNYWLYNIYNVLNFSFFSFYFTSFFKNKYWKNIFYALIISFIVASGSVILSTGTFFESTPQFVTLTGTLLLFFSVVLFYFELLRSDMLLQLKRFLPFYISVWVLVFNLCIAPIDILSQYFSIEDGNELFVKLHLYVLFFANIFIYSTFIFGFLICSRKKKSY